MPFLPPPPRNNATTTATIKVATAKVNSARDDILDPLKLPSLLLSIGITGKEYEAAAREEYILKKETEINVAKEELEDTEYSLGIIQKDLKSMHGQIVDTNAQINTLTQQLSTFQEEFEKLQKKNDASMSTKEERKKVLNDLMKSQDKTPV
jgi:peptidoglycan hydrolase CwlO-like protein